MACNADHKSGLNLGGDHKIFGGQLLVGRNQGGLRYAKLFRLSTRRQHSGARCKRALLNLRPQPGVDPALRTACRCIGLTCKLAHGNTSKLALFVVQVVVDINGYPAMGNEIPPLQEAYVLDLTLTTSLVTFAGVFLICLMKGALGGGFAVVGIPLLSLVMESITADGLLAPLFIAMDLFGLRYWKPSTWSKPDMKLLIPGLVLRVGIRYLFFWVVGHRIVAIMKPPLYPSLTVTSLTRCSLC
ncbi:hypothetical protein [Pseudomonas koreensis]|uniref:hypothetical protein n=1 Tax=Pseudomonas koreensis TaxID=198620 RepID=UPI003F8499F6